MSNTNLITATHLVKKPRSWKKLRIRSSVSYNAEEIAITLEYFNPAHNHEFFLIESLWEHYFHYGPIVAETAEEVAERANSKWVEYQREWFNSNASKIEEGRQEIVEGLITELGDGFSKEVIDSSVRISPKFIDDVFNANKCLDVWQDRCEKWL